MQAYPNKDAKFLVCMQLHLGMKNILLLCNIQQLSANGFAVILNRVFLTHSLT